MIGAPRYRRSCCKPPTRREVLLFGLLVLALAWLMMSLYPTRIISVPDVATSTTMLVKSFGSLLA
jgi:hypothetical protein